MTADTYATYREIKSQTRAWAQALEVTRDLSFPSPRVYRQVIFTGCGSTYYLSVAAAALYQELTGRPARAVPAGELILNPGASVAWLPRAARRGPPRRELLVAVSRSGTTTETLNAARKFGEERRGDVMVISNNDHSLSRLADVNLVISQGQEQSVAQTRSFASMYVAACAVCARMAGREDLVETMMRLPQVGEALIAKYESFAERTGSNLELDRFYFLGSGTRYGLACEASLKTKEMTLTHSEPFHFLEFRHGPMSMVNERAFVVGLLSDANRAPESKVLSEMKALGGAVASLGESDAEVEFGSGLPAGVRGVLYLPVLQLMAFYRSMAKGLNPDQPNNLAAVVKLDLDSPGSGLNGGRTQG
jgi:glucosamine--fructose-6-phosphate aminotransferase (isomerizing)